MTLFFIKDQKSLTAPGKLNSVGYFLVIKLIKTKKVYLTLVKLVIEILNQ